MGSSYRSFVRNPDGSWTCIAGTTVIHPRGRMQVAEGSRFYPGTEFMGVDIVALLEEDRRQDENSAPATDSQHSAQA
jgi:hypothetical protein